MASLRWTRAPVVAALMLIPGNSVSHTQTQQRDPYGVLTFSIPNPSGRQTVNVTTGRELQAALDNATAGDVIVLAESAAFRPVAPEGSFMLRNRPLPAGQWVTIRSANRAFDQGGAVPPSTRVDKTNANVMPKIRATAANAGALRAERRARGSRLIGLDIGMGGGVTKRGNLGELGPGGDTKVD